MSLVLDQSGDVNQQEMLAYHYRYQLPNFVVEATRDQLIPAEETKQASNSALYAQNWGSRQFPCHTPAATILSQVFFLEKQAQIPDANRRVIRDRLSEMADYWRVRKDFDRITAKHAELCKEAAVPDEHFGLVVSVGPEKIRKYPLTNSLEVKQAATWFMENLPAMRDEFTIGDRQTMARKILRRVEETYCKLAESEELCLHKCAGYGLADNALLAQNIRQRLAVGKKIPAEIRSSMEKVASEILQLSQAPFANEFAVTLADELEAFDRTYQIDMKYAAVIKSPEDLLWGTTFKQAEEQLKNATFTLTKKAYDKHDFAKLSYYDLEEAFGEDMAQAMTDGLRGDPEKMAEIVPTLPLPDARMLDDMLFDKGVKTLA